MEATNKKQEYKKVFSLKLCNLKVLLPVTPYKSQIQFMNAMLRCFRNSICGLLESPTGSGKTLSILAASLAFTSNPAAYSSSLPNSIPGDIKGTQGQTNKKRKDAILMEDAKTSMNQDDDLPKRPRIYFATRTHSQIKQIVKELHRFTPFYSVNVTPLASRKHTCVNPMVKGKLDINNECKKAVKNNNCRWQKQYTRLANDWRLDKPFDLEDLKKLSVATGGCPFYAMRARAETSELILTPYQYLLDERYRKAMKLVIKDSLIIFDEAHNIENICRDSMSRTFRLGELSALNSQLKTCIETGWNASACLEIKKLIQNILNWASEEFSALKSRQAPAGKVDGGYNKGYGSKNKQLFNEPSKTSVFKDRALKNLLGRLGLSPSSLSEFSQALISIKSSMEAEQGSSSSQNASSSTQEKSSNLKSVSSDQPLPDPFLDILSDIMIVLKNILKPNTTGLQDFIMALELPTPNELRVRLQRNQSEIDLVKLNFWCLNPAIAFRQLRKSARSILLTSGTLSPMESFESELGTLFPVKLSAPHVIGKDQCLAFSVSDYVAEMPSIKSNKIANRDPMSVKFFGTFKETEKIEYQDALGAMLLEATKRIAGGCLVFLPSYSLMGKLKRRWETTGLAKQLERSFPAKQESKGSSYQTKKAGQASHRDNLKGRDFYNNKGYRADASSAEKRLLFWESKEELLFNKDITAYKTHCLKKEGSAVLFAVCRGKASEGIDFRDDLSRLVFVVGIPYAAAMDELVIQKKLWNDERAKAGATIVSGKNNPGFIHSHPPNEIDGRTWYDLQAFRAINQAAGRCIRHKGDYGIIFFVDKRFTDLSKRKYISKWMEEYLQKEHSWEDIRRRIASFIDGAKKLPACKLYGDDIEEDESSSEKL